MLHEAVQHEGDGGQGSKPVIGTVMRPELRKLAQAILDGIDPAVRVAAAMASGGGPGTP